MVPTVAQVKAMRLAMPPHLTVLVDLATGSGIRLGEALGLTVDRVDSSARTLTTDRQVGPDGRFTTPKSVASVRTLPVPDWLMSAVTGHVDTFGCGSDGRLITDCRTLVGDALRSAARAAGLPKGTGLHCLRHFYASLLIRAGLSVKAVQARLGHATAGETLDTYSHLWPDDDDRTRAAVADVWGLGPVGNSGSSPVGIANGDPAAAGALDVLRHSVAT
jgi:integrase